MPLIKKIVSPVQHYAWGGEEFISELLDQQFTEPAAELWMGTHERGVSTLASDSKDSLADVVAKEELCGSAGLPFLFKVLDARNMLSIQLHPHAAAAQAGFERENETNIPIDGPNRNYRDTHAKPELHCALTAFWMLWGIRPVSELIEVMNTELYAKVLDVSYSSQEDVDAEHEAVCSALTAILGLTQESLQQGVDWLHEQWQEDPPVDDKTHDYWMHQALEQHCVGAIDPGLFVIPLLNLVKLQPGQGSFQPAGVVHAYLRGTTMELMENSDNVLRAGLTPKHVDVQELLSNIDCSQRQPIILEGLNLGENAKVYETEEASLRLTSECLNGSQKWKASSCTIGIVMEGTLEITQNGSSVVYNKGEQFFAPKSARGVFNGHACSFFTATSTEG